MEEEVWKDIPGYEGRYQVSDIGRVRSLNYRGTGKVSVLKLSIDKDGYHVISLFSKTEINQQYRSFRVGRLVGIVFVPNPDNKPEIDHINGIRTDDRVENLRWTTRKENDNNPHCLKRKSETRMGKLNHQFGKKASLELRQKLSESHNGIKHNEKWKQNTARGLWKKVVQIDSSGSIIKVWNSIKDATESIGVSKGKISSVCRHYPGRKTCGGYRWEFWHNYCEKNNLTTDPQQCGSD